MNELPWLLIGNGRLASHLALYLSQLGIHFQHWYRSQGISALPQFLAGSSRVLLAISDSALPGFLQNEIKNFPGPKIHFSGAWHSEAAIGVHPLMTFTKELTPALSYPEIPMMLTGTQTLQEALPGWHNPFYTLAAKDRAFYHACCVMGGNFTTMLVQKMLQGLHEIGLPPEVAKPYLERTLQNIFRHPETALTGPLVRRDVQTLQKHLQVLQNDSFHEVYRAFVHAHSPELFDQMMEIQ